MVAKAAILGMSELHNGDALSNRTIAQQLNLPMASVRRNVNELRQMGELVKYTGVFGDGNYSRLPMYSGVEFSTAY